MLGRLSLVGRISNMIIASTGDPSGRRYQLFIFDNFQQLELLASEVTFALFKFVDAVDAA